MKTIILTVLVSFTALCANAMDLTELKQNMKMNAVISSRAVAKSTADSKVVEFIGYSEFTKGSIEVKPQLKYAGKNIEVFFFMIDDALAYAYDKSKKYDKVEVKLVVDDKDITVSDPHHLVPVYAKITASKKGKTVEEGLKEVFSVELWEIWDVNRPVTPKYTTPTRTGDPHYNEFVEEKTAPSTKKSEEKIIFEDRYHRF